jgi:hypothetical protein
VLHLSWGGRVHTCIQGQKTSDCLGSQVNRQRRNISKSRRKCIQSPIEVCAAETLSAEHDHSSGRNPLYTHYFTQETKKQATHRESVNRQTWDEARQGKSHTSAIEACTARAFGAEHQLPSGLYRTQEQNKRRAGSQVNEQGNESRSGKEVLRAAIEVCTAKTLGAIPYPGARHSNLHTDRSKRHARDLSQRATEGKVKEGKSQNGDRSVRQTSVR